MGTNSYTRSWGSQSGCESPALAQTKWAQALKLWENTVIPLRFASCIGWPGRWSNRVTLIGCLPPRHACKLLSFVVSPALVLVQEMSITSDIVSHIGPIDTGVRFLALLEAMN